MAGDLHWGSVGLALHMDDVGLTDVKGNAMTLIGVVRSDTESKFGGYSAYFDGSSELYNTAALTPDISTGDFSAQFWVNPSAQGQLTPTVFKTQDVSLEYKPAGFANGFTLNVGTTRTALGYHSEGSWYYISIVQTSTAIEVWIDGQLAHTHTGVGGTFDPQVWIGRFSGIGEKGFVGYVDDLLVTPSVARTDHSVPTAAFPEFAPDPVGSGAAAVLVQGVAAGEVPPSGFSSGAIRIRCTGAGRVPSVGVGSGLVRITGSGVAVPGRAMTGSARVRIAGSGGGSASRVCVGSGRVFVRASGAARHGASSFGSGPVRVAASSAGSSPAAPVGVGSGVVRVFGYGTAGMPVEEFCA